MTLGEATAVPAASPGSRLGERSRSPSRSGSRYRGQVPQGAAGGSRRLGERGGSRRSTAPAAEEQPLAHANHTGGKRSTSAQALCGQREQQMAVKSRGNVAFFMFIHAAASGKSRCCSAGWINAGWEAERGLGTGARRRPGRSGLPTDRQVHFAPTQPTAPPHARGAPARREHPRRSPPATPHPQQEKKIIPHAHGRR